jgi:uncharacterized RmlC-like cupin family protein
LNATENSDEDDVMAKAGTGQAPPAKVKATAAAGKKIKPAAAVSTKQAATTATVKKPLAKLASAPRKATPEAYLSRKAAVRDKAPALKKAAAKMSVSPQKAPPRKAVSGTVPARKVVAPKTVAPKNAAKTVAVKKAAPRRPTARIAVPTPPARRGRPAAPPRKAPATARKLGSAPQVFTVSHLNEADFKADGLRAYAQYRDLGIAAATGGLCQAHVIRMVPPCTDEVRKRHLHQADLQLVYVLKGWMKNEFEGHGEQMMSTGSCWLQPSGIKHTVLDYSPDCEVLEIIVPADFKTEELA